MRNHCYQVEIRDYLSIRASNPYSILLVVDGERMVGLYKYQRKKLSRKLFEETLYHRSSYFKNWIKKGEIINYYVTS